MRPLQSAPLATVSFTSLPVTQLFQPHKHTRALKGCQQTAANALLWPSHKHNCCYCLFVLQSLWAFFFSWATQILLYSQSIFCDCAFLKVLCSMMNRFRYLEDNSRSWWAVFPKAQFMYLLLFSTKLLCNIAEWVCSNTFHYTGVSKALEVEINLSILLLDFHSFDKSTFLGTVFQNFQN